MGREWIRQMVLKHFPGIFFDVEVPPDSKMGDYAANIAFVLAKEERDNPHAVARRVVSVLTQDKELMDRCDKVKAAAAGFVNFYLKKSVLQNELRLMHWRGTTYGRSTFGKGKKAIVEYSSPNIAKPMHIGHIRTTIIGDALANIHEFLGYKVIRWNYLGDWGTQFGKLIAAYKLWGDRKAIEAHPIKELLALYVRFHDELKKNPLLEARGREEFKKLEQGDRENRRLWQWFKQESLGEFQRIYKALDVRFTITTGESDNEKELAPLVDFLVQQKLVEKNDGAIIFNLEKFKLPPALVQKSDGTSLYFTRELVTLQKRVDKYAPALMLYVVGNEQTLHFQQLFAAAQLLGLNTTELVHIKYGLVLGPDRQKMATREGEAVPLEEVLEKGIELARKAVEQKNPGLSLKEKDLVARAVGIGALKYNDLKEHRTSDVVFDWKRMLDLTGNSGPYLQYTYARLASIVRKAGGFYFQRLIFRPDATLLNEEIELRIIRHLLNFPDVIRESAELCLTNNLALYLYELANLANQFYERVRVIDDDDKKRVKARVMLVETLMMTLKRGLNLLGIQAPERI